MVNDSLHSSIPPHEIIETINSAIKNDPKLMFHLKADNRLNILGFSNIGLIGIRPFLFEARLKHFSSRKQFIQWSK